MIETSVYISLENVRPVNVTVIGEVNLPGVQTLTGMSSVMDALIISGGIKRTGSLRNIILIQNGNKYKIDLYNLLFSNETNEFSNISLGHNSTIIVPPIGRTVAVTGYGVKNGIFELDSSKQIDDLVKLNGGFFSKGKKIVSLKRFNDDGVEQIIGNIGLEEEMLDGDIAIFSVKPNEKIKQVYVTGAVKSTTILALDQFSDLKYIFENVVDFNQSSYKFSFVVKSNGFNFENEKYKIYKFKDVLRGKKIPLKPMDEILILEKGDLDFLSDNSVIKILTNPQSSKNEDYDCKALNYLENYINSLGNSGAGISNF